MRCLILDDEPPARLELRQLLLATPGVEVIGEASNVKAALELSEIHHPDAVFIDIKLRGENGFAYVEGLKEAHPYLVFVTAFDRYAVQAFECNAIDYLLKPVHPERLAETLRRICKRQGESAGDPLLLKAGNMTRLHSWKEIHHIVSEGNYSRVFLEDGSSLLKLRPLKEWIPLAPEGSFVQVHRTAVVRPDTIREILYENERRQLRLTNGALIPIGRSYWPTLRALLPR